MTGTAPIDPTRVMKILEQYSPKVRASLVNVLHDLQAEFRYLPEESLRMAADYLGISPARLFEVATFYEGFRLKPRGEHVCTVCMGTACHVRGSPRLLEQMERDMGIHSGQTTKDLKFSLETVNCVGACALGPLVIVDGNYYGDMTPSRLSRLVGSLQEKKGNQ